MSFMNPSDQARNYAGLPYTLQLKEDRCGGDVCFVARIMEISGCLAQGETKEKAVAELKAMLPEFFQAMIEANAEIPLPRPSVEILVQPPKGATLNITLPSISRYKQTRNLQEGPVLNPSQEQIAYLVPA